MKSSAQREAAEDQRLRVTFLGTGGAFSRRFGHTNVLVETEPELGLTLVDCGPLAPTRLELLGHCPSRLRHILISHLHADHIGGLEELAFRFYFQWQKRPTLAIPEALVEPLWEHSLRGGLDCVSDPEGVPRSCTLDSFFEVLPLPAGCWTEIGGLAVWPFTVDHVPTRPSFGFAIEDLGADQTRLILSCDARRQLPELLKDPLVPPFDRGPIFHDCQLRDAGPSGIHTTLNEILEYPEAIRRRIVVTHYGDDIDDFLDRIESGGLRVAWPGGPKIVADWRQTFGCDVPAFGGAAGGRLHGYGFKS